MVFHKLFSGEKRKYNHCQWNGKTVDIARIIYMFSTTIFYRSGKYICDTMNSTYEMIARFNSSTLLSDDRITPSSTKTRIYFSMFISVWAEKILLQIYTFRLREKEEIENKYDLKVLRRTNYMMMFYVFQRRTISRWLWLEC